MVYEQYIHSCSCFCLFFFLSMSNNHLKKKIWLVIKSGAWHTACDSLSRSVLNFFRRNVVPDPFFRPIVVLDELSIRRNGFRRNVLHPTHWMHSLLNLINQ